MLRLITVFFALGFVLLTACSKDDEQPVVVTSTTAPAATTDASAKPTAPTATGNDAVSNEALSFEGADGTTLKGHLYANAGPKRNIAIVVSDQAQKTLATYAGDFVGKGVAVYTYDVRGVGETGGSKNEAQMDKDLEVAVRLIKSREYARIYVVGLGEAEAGAAFRVAARQDLAGVAGLPAVGPVDVMPQVAEAKLFMAFENDEDTVETMQRAYNAAPQPATQVVVPAPAQPPTDMLSVPAVKQAILDFVSK
jgi:alpha/beta superfamily hydrolase